jgi:hypothetical protein
MGYEGTELQKLFFDLAIMSITPKTIPSIPPEIIQGGKVTMPLRDFLLKKYGQYIR